jgi:hypothetical protein
MTVEACDPNEDHEAFAGEVLLDPWDDPAQTDWPMNPTNKEVEDGNSVGADEGHDQPS